MMRFRTAAIACLLLGGGASGATAQEAGQLGIPLDCDAGRDCFVQQYPDFDPGPGAADPFCGTKTYDGHDGTDIRVLSMADVTRGVKVLALGEGRVLRARDGLADRLLKTPDDRAAVAGRECGNGLVIALSSGLEAQYCHLKRGSIAVRSGDVLQQGDTVGLVGASGAAAFPHVHITLRKAGTVVDPATGRSLSTGCTPTTDQAASLWSAEARQWLADADAPILAIGLAGAPPSYDDLVESGPPPELKAGDGATVGWGWFANLQAGDQTRIVITAPDGRVFSDTTSEQLPRSKAASMQFGGRSRAPVSGVYRLRVEVLRDGEVAAARDASVDVGG
ncbi:M23 family metallopeptidase [Jiella mangrovi]|uniref:M23 family metallopeptidase n=1 Tax=Jiella mangrovi TaxID=2821407 RepID=A0ABS4BDX2_9HYPH|nr:M23 family metallopeptidase [Jiella mangrovi]MBP0614950.1 M23 family metallopeptidase [Jiella mangrovi]